MPRRKEITIITSQGEGKVRNEQYELALAYAQIPKAVLRDLKQKYFFFRSTYVSGNPHGTSYFEGQRSVVLDILSMIKSIQNPELFESSEEEET